MALDPLLSGDKLQDRISTNCTLYILLNQMKESSDGTKTARFTKSSSAEPYPLVLDIDDFKVIPKTLIH